MYKHIMSPMRCKAWPERCSLHMPAHDAYDAHVQPGLPSRHQRAFRDCRDGLERVQVPDTGTLADMWAAVSKALDIPLERMALTKDPKLVSFWGQYR